MVLSFAPASRRLANAVGEQDAMGASLMRVSYFQAPPTPAQRAAMVESWGGFLSRWEWDWFVTLTFRPHRGKKVGSRSRLPHPEQADKLFRLWISRLNRHLYGNHCWKKGMGVGWVRASEPHQSGALHYHALLTGTGVTDARRLDWKDDWYALAGFSRIEPPSSQDAVQAYCAKYVAKGGEIDFGGAALHSLRQPSFACKASLGRSSTVSGSVV